MTLESTIISTRPSRDRPRRVPTFRPSIYAVNQMGHLTIRQRHQYHRHHHPAQPAGIF
jgi:hypothetical protein